MTPSVLIEQFGPREAMEYDIVVVGGGPAGLAAAIRIKQRAASSGKDVSVVVLEKGSEPGAHILSGAVMDPIALTELLPNWKADGAPLNQPVTSDEVWFFTSPTASFKTPDALLPDNFHNQGNYAISLSDVVRWMAQQAEALGVEIFPGFAGAELVFNDDGSVKGVATGNLGVAKDGTPSDHFQLGMELHGKYTLFAEGSRGQLGRELIARFALDAGRDPQAYALGVKELWEIDPARAKPGLVVHTGGWPMESDTYGGGFLYHLEGNKVTLGLVTGLDYANPYLSPFEEMQRWKTHPKIAGTLQGAKRIGYGARAITTGGLLALPKTVFPGGALIGCDAGFLNGPRIKGSHAAIKTGMLAAEAAFDAVTAGRQHDELTAFPAAFDASWLKAELDQARNFKGWFKKGLVVGSVMLAVEYWLLPKLGVKSPPWTIHRDKPDYACLKPAAECKQIVYPKPDGKLTFDRLSSVFISNTNHEEQQPPHLTLKNAGVPVRINLALYAGPEARYCPAGVYEYIPDGAGSEKLQINAQNCVHCKTCDIKDPMQNIVWVAPEGGGGPNYSGM